MLLSTVLKTPAIINGFCHLIFLNTFFQYTLIPKKLKKNYKKNILKYLY